MEAGLRLGDVDDHRRDRRAGREAQRDGYIVPGLGDAGDRLYGVV